MEAMTAAATSNDSAYQRACKGLLKGIPRWIELDTVWERLRHRNDGGWYIYTVGRPAPAGRTQGRLLRDRLRRRSRGTGFLQIYEPGSLGMVCGSSEAPPLPGWTLSRVPPR